MNTTMELRTALEALTPITSQRFLDTNPVLQHIEIYADSDGFLTGALATDRYVVALVGTHDDPAAYIDPVQAKQLLAHLKAHKNGMIPPMLDRETGTILGIPVTLPDNMPVQYPSAVARILSDAEDAAPSELPLGTGLGLPAMELAVKIIKPLYRGKSARGRNNLGLRLEARGNVILTQIDDLTLLVLPMRLHD